MKNYNCYTCQEPMVVTIQFHTYIRANGPQKQRCNNCGAVHDVDEKNNIRLLVGGLQVAKLSAEFPYPEHKPYRVGAYRVRFSTGNWAASYITWNGDIWHDGPVLFHAGSIVSWQGLAGDMEHKKRMPYVHLDPLPVIEGDDE